MFCAVPAAPLAASALAGRIVRPEQPPVRRLDHARLRAGRLPVGTLQGPAGPLRDRLCAGTDCREKTGSWIASQ